jgi:integron integrase
LRTEKSYVYWARFFIHFHKLRHPETMGAAEVTAFLNHLATTRKVAAATQNQALAALLFLYKEVLGIQLPWLNGLVRAKRSPRLPSVLTRDEVERILGRLKGTRWLILSLIYGAGLRQNECLGLRVKDIDLEGSKLLIRDPKGGRDRVTILPVSLKAPLAAHLEKVRALHQRDLARGLGEAPLPRALSAKYPKAAFLVGWQFVFPSTTHCKDPYTGHTVRYHVHETTVARSIQHAARTAGIEKHVSCHTFRHAFATHLLETGHNIRTVQELMGHKNVETTMIYTHVMRHNLREVRSPVDYMGERQPAVATR